MPSNLLARNSPAGHELGRVPNAALRLYPDLAPEGRVAITYTEAAPRRETESVYSRHQNHGIARQAAAPHPAGQRVKQEDRS